MHNEDHGKQATAIELMSRQTITRRALLQSTGAGAILCALKPSSICQASQVTSTQRIKITEPFQGAILDHRHGKQLADSLTIRVSGEVHADGPVTINGAPCRREANQFEAHIPLGAHETELVAAVGQGTDRSEDRVRVVWNRYSVPRYRFAIDDNSFLFRDIAQKKYKSLFDCFYLKNLRDLHEKYGTKFVLNCFYVTADGAELPKPGDFTLAQFPDRYKGQWHDTADWLKLAFHAYANMPARPYQDATASKIIHDMDLVGDEIRRFAGEETYTPTTCIHFGMTPRSALKPLYDHGVRVLSTDFYHKRPPKPLKGHWDINQELPDDISEYCATHDAWKDFDSGIVISMIDIVCNKVAAKDTTGLLKSLTENPLRSEIMDLFTHEQYFWPFYPHYVPDHWQRIEAAIRFVSEHGYQPVFFHEGLLGGRV
jgi:hypothetical protein